MNILLVAATKHEIAPFKKTKFKCDILITGVGIAATIYHLQKKLYHNKYNMVIQAGIAGTFDRSFGLGKTVIVKKDCFGDLGTEEKGKFSSVFENGFAGKNIFPFSKGWLVNRNEIVRSVSLPIVSAVTVNKISDRIKQKKQLSEAFHPDIESMEGAALHYVCLQEKIPFIQLRSISNFVGVRNKSKWEMNESIEGLNKELIKLISYLTEQK